jgi:hypothetical protein
VTFEPGKAGGILLETKSEPLVLIPLTRGGKYGDGQMRYALVDAADYPLVSDRRWQVQWDGTTGRFYASASYKDERGTYTLGLARAILGLRRGDRLHADHANLSVLDNRRSNLRRCSPAQNSYNRARRRNNTSGFKGVFREGSRWRAMIRFGRLHHLGMFATAQEAAQAYDRAATRLHGEYARVNGA